MDELYERIRDIIRENKITMVVPKARDYTDQETTPKFDLDDFLPPLRDYAIVLSPTPTHTLTKIQVVQIKKRKHSNKDPQNDIYHS